LRAAADVARTGRRTFDRGAESVDTRLTAGRAGSVCTTGVDGSCTVLRPGGRVRMSLQVEPPGCRPHRDHHVADIDTARPGPITLAQVWSHRAGARQLERGLNTWARNGRRLVRFLVRSQWAVEDSNLRPHPCEG